MRSQHTLTVLGHTITAVLCPDDDGGFVVECPALPGCISQGDNEAEALVNIQEAIELFLECGEVPKAQDELSHLTTK